MDVPSIVGTQVPLWRSVFLAWLTAALLHVQWGVPISIQEVPPLEFALQAGLLFGCYSTLVAAARLFISLPGVAIAQGIAILITSRQPRMPGPSAVDIVRADPMWSRFLHWLGRTLSNLGDVAAMLLAFLLYSNRLLIQLAPIGLTIRLALCVFGRYDRPSEKRTPS
jgi:hypothetical protein